MKRIGLSMLALALAGAIHLAAQAAEESAPEKKIIVPKEKTPLWTKSEMQGWDFVLKDPDVKPESVWSIEDGVVRCKGEPLGFMRTQADYADYKFHVEWRWIGEPGNNGVLLHCQGPNVCADKNLFPTCIEAQLKSGSAGDIVIMYGSRIKEIERDYPPNSPFLVKEKLHPSNEKPSGEWNTYDITCQGDTIQMYVNGLLQNKATGASLRSGSIALQSEGGVIEFRNAYIAPLAEEAKAAE